MNRHLGRTGLLLFLTTWLLLNQTVELELNQTSKTYITAKAGEDADNLPPDVLALAERKGEKERDVERRLKEKQEAETQRKGKELADEEMAKAYQEIEEENRREQTKTQSPSSPTLTEYPASINEKEKLRETNKNLDRLLKESKKEAKKGNKITAEDLDEIQRQLIEGVRATPQKGNNEGGPTKMGDRRNERIDAKSRENGDKLNKKRRETEAREGREKVQREAEEEQKNKKRLLLEKKEQERVRKVEEARLQSKREVEQKRVEEDERARNEAEEKRKIKEQTLKKEAELKVKQEAVEIEIQAKKDAEEKEKKEREEIQRKVEVERQRAEQKAEVEAEQKLKQAKEEEKHRKEAEGKILADQERQRLLKEEEAKQEEAEVKRLKDVEELKKSQEDEDSVRVQQVQKQIVTAEQEKILIKRREEREREREKQAAEEEERIRNAAQNEALKLAADLVDAEDFTFHDPSRDTQVLESPSMNKSGYKQQIWEVLSLDSTSSLTVFTDLVYTSTVSILLSSKSLVFIFLFLTLLKAVVTLFTLVVSLISEETISVQRVSRFLHIIKTEFDSAIPLLINRREKLVLSGGGAADLTGSSESQKGQGGRLPEFRGLSEKIEKLAGIVKRITEDMSKAESVN